MHYIWTAISTDCRWFKLLIVSLFHPEVPFNNHNKYCTNLPFCRGAIIPLTKTLSHPPNISSERRKYFRLITDLSEWIRLCFQTMFIKKYLTSFITSGPRNNVVILMKYHLIHCERKFKVVLTKCVNQLILRSMIKQCST